ncbi:hypothetical protein FHW36_10315 [Chitinophaga polysaccharea]|uniref:Uncharacterized protein n=1 Tax=Chitinophaga polysaccharea TaxID=1293035 RepID=A0A561PSZ7_9BACT|nr:hypothetical protein FHW36_10315 [Chitinophaga polysaccharea]
MGGFSIKSYMDYLERQIMQSAISMKTHYKNNASI